MNESAKAFLLNKGFTERDIKEIEFACLYDDKFKHGTDGHNRLVIIARLTGLVFLLKDDRDSRVE